MENNNENVRLNKIPLLIFIETLQDIYQMGVDFVDIVGTNNVDQDIIAIHYNDSYFSKPENLENENKLNPPNFKINLSEEDLNDLT